MQPYRLLLLLFFITLLIGALIYNYQNIVVSVKDASHNKIKTTLDTHQAIRQFVHHIQRPNIEELRQQNIIQSDLFLPQLESSSYITVRFQQFLNQTNQFKGFTLRFKYASLSPLNPDFVANEEERALIERFNNNEINSYESILDTNGSKEFVYALPAERISKECLTCHGNPEDAPQGLASFYGKDSGFNHNIGDINALFSFHMPIDNLLDDAYTKFYKQSVFILVIALILYLFLEAFFKRTEKHRKLQSEAQELTSLVNTFNRHIISTQTDLHGVITEASNAFCTLSGYSKEELIGEAHSIVRHPDQDSNLFSDLWKELKNNRLWIGEIQNRGKQGNDFWVNTIITPIYDTKDNKIGYFAIKQDITEKKQIEFNATHDKLSGLLNRYSFENTFLNEYKRARREQNNLIFIMIDIDHFKLYNDTYGHPTGDIIIRDISNTLKLYFKRPHDFVYRMGGEEFGVITSKMSTEEIINFCNELLKLIQSLDIKHEKNTNHHVVTISIGIDVLLPEETYSFKTMIDNADNALYQAKQSGRNCVKIYNSSNQSSKNE